MDDYVFATNSGARIQDKELRATFYDALDRAGLGHLRDDIDKHGDPRKPMVFHDLRHSFCSWAVDVWSVPDVKEFAGHRQHLDDYEVRAANREDEPRLRRGRGAPDDAGTRGRAHPVALRAMGEHQLGVSRWPPWHAHQNALLIAACGSPCSS
jgi:hypothetical protein